MRRNFMKKILYYLVFSFCIPVIIFIQCCKNEPTAIEINDPPELPANPYPPDYSIDQFILTDLSWECSDPEGDPLTYDIYFGTAVNPPLVISNYTSTTYYPGTLEYNNTYYWRIIAKDNHNNSIKGTLWTFSSEAKLTIDQLQIFIDYGFWFEKDVERWQEFFPEKNNLSRLELYIDKWGNPGDIIVSIKTDNAVTLSEKTILQEDITSGWNAINYHPPVTLNPGVGYKIFVRSTMASPTTENRYFWAGSNYSGYPGVTDVTRLWPDYDYAFITYAEL